MTNTTKKALALVFVVFVVMFFVVGLVRADIDEGLSNFFSEEEEITQTTGSGAKKDTEIIIVPPFTFKDNENKEYSIKRVKTEAGEYVWMSSEDGGKSWEKYTDSYIPQLNDWSEQRDLKMRKDLGKFLEKFGFDSLGEALSAMPEEERDELMMKILKSEGTELAEAIEVAMKAAKRERLRKKYASGELILDFARIGMAVGQALDAWGIRPDWPWIQRGYLGELSKWFAKWGGIEEAAGTLCYMRMDKDFSSAIVVGPGGYPAMHIEAKKYNVSGKFVECDEDKICKEKFNAQHFCGDDGLCKKQDGETAEIEKEYIYKITLYVNFNNIAKKDKFVEFRVYLDNELVDLNMDGRALENDEGDINGDFVRKKEGEYSPEANVFYITENDHGEICIKFTNCDNIKLDVAALLNDCKFCNGVPGEDVTSQGYLEAIKYIFR